MTMARSVTRRQFFAISAAAGAAGAATALPPAAASETAPVAMLIDLTRCDGCPDRDTPRCVAACRDTHRAKFPEPRHPIPDNWPTGTHEDWSNRRHLTTTLTPYNWTFVQHVAVEHDGRTETVHVPRHCMHCDNPPCAHLCPFGAQTKQPEGPVVIDPDLCLGGAKCRTVCPWGIPQRQSGVGMYMAWQPVPAGGGVMYKCDLCIDRIRDGTAPACVSACDRDAVVFGPKDAVKARAQERAAAIGGHTYGIGENGGTSVFYVSRVPFETIDAALRAKKERFRMPVAVRNPLEKANRLAEAVVLAPLAAGLGAVLAAAGTVWRLGRGHDGASRAPADEAPASAPPAPADHPAPEEER
jgi:Fe-S-cluster-containing dehydrogenase component